MAKTRYELFEQGLIRKYKDVTELSPEARQMGQKAAVVLKEPGWSPHNIRDIYLYGGGAYVSYYVNPTEFKGSNSISFAGGKIEGEDKRPLLNVLHKMSNLSALVSNLQSIIIFVDKTKRCVRTLEEGNPNALYVAMPDGSYSCSPNDVWQGIGGKEYSMTLLKTSTCNDVDIRFVDISDGFLTFKAEKGAVEDKSFLLTRIKEAKLNIAEDINKKFFAPLGVNALNMRLDGDKHAWTVVEDAVQGKTSTFNFDDTANAKISKLLSGAKTFDTDAEMRAHIVGSRTFTAKSAEAAATWNNRVLNFDFVEQFGGCLQAWTSNTAVYPVDAKLLDTYEQEVRKPYDALCYATAELQRLGITADELDGKSLDDTKELVKQAMQADYFKNLQLLFKQMAYLQRTATTNREILHYTEDEALKEISGVLCNQCMGIFANTRMDVVAALKDTMDRKAVELANKLGSENKDEVVQGGLILFGFLCKYYLRDILKDYSFCTMMTKQCDQKMGELTEEQQKLIEMCAAPLIYAITDVLTYYIAYVSYIRLDILHMEKGLTPFWLTLRGGVCNRVLNESAALADLDATCRKFYVTNNMRTALILILQRLAKKSGTQPPVDQMVDKVFGQQDALFIKTAEIKKRDRSYNMKIAMELMKLSLESKKDGGSN